MWIVLVVIGAFITSFTLLAVKRGKQSEQWQKCEGKVVSAEVEEERRYDPEDGTSVYYYPRVHYEYQVGDKTYQGKKLKMLEASMSKKKANETIASFSTGSTVEVYYDPQKPEQAVLQPGTQKFSYVFLVVGMLCILAGLVMAFL